MEKIINFVKRHNEVIGGISVVITIVSGGFEFYRHYKDKDDQLNIYKQKEYINNEIIKVWHKSNNDYQKITPWYLRYLYPPIPIIIETNAFTTQSHLQSQTPDPRLSNQNTNQ